MPMGSRPCTYRATAGAPPRGKRFAQVVGILALMVCGSAHAAPTAGPAAPPAALEASEDGKLIAVPGEARPKPGDKLPLPSVHKVAADKPIAAAAGKGPLQDQEQPSKPREPLRSAVEVDVGYTWVSDSVVSAVHAITSPAQKRRDRHPDLQGFGIDAGYRMSLGSAAWVVFRAGLTIPTMPDQNWWSSSGTPKPLYTATNLVAIDLGADYLRRIEITDWLAWTVRGGIGLTMLAGSVRQTETLPICSQAQAATCPHWKSVASSDVSLPPVLPAVRLLTGIEVNVSKELGLSLQAGLRSAPYLGGGLSWAF